MRGQTRVGEIHKRSHGEVKVIFSCGPNGRTRERKYIVIYALYQPSFFYCRRRKQKKASSQREQDERHSSLTRPRHMHEIPDRTIPTCFFLDYPIPPLVNLLFGQHSSSYSGHIISSSNFYVWQSHYNKRSFDWQHAY